MSALRETLATLASVLNESGFSWYIFGAQAVSVHAAPRATQDLDVTVLADHHQINRVVERLVERGIQHRFPALAAQLLANGAVLPLIHTASSFEVDLVIGASGLEALAASRAIKLSIAGIQVPVASPTDLVVMKVLAGRGKDLEDIRALLATGQVDTEEALDLVQQLEAALDQSDLLPILQAAIAESNKLP